MSRRPKWAELPSDDPGLGCHESEVPRSLLPAEVKPWEMRVSYAQITTGPVLRYGTEGARRVEHWRLNSP
jgi:hypothetical protein